MYLVVFIAFAFFVARRALTYLHFFQQEEYDNARFLRWVVHTFSIDRRATLCLIVVAGLQLAGIISDLISASLVTVVFLSLGAIESDPRVKGKKRLSMTTRARRILGVALVVEAIMGIALTLGKAHALWWLIGIHGVPLSLVLANLILSPFERSVQKRYWNEAHEKLLAIRPTTIGITGSYGKTSVKHILGHILGQSAPTLMTPASVNTPMGVSRIVREQLRPGHKYFVCEMGAYKKGSIRKMCELAPPDMAVITAIGSAHYERFRTLGTVAEAKFELAEAVVPKGGKVIVTEQVAGVEYAAGFIAKHPINVVIIGRGEKSSLRILALSSSDQGTQVDILWNGAPYTLKVPLYGEHHGENVAIAFAAACELGMAPADAISILASTPQIAHRLEVKRHESGAVLIDDAYNSNPVGFANALRLLDLFHRNGGRRILVSPGMVELGRIHDEEHRKIGVLAREHVDVLLPVVPARIKTLTDAYLTGNPGGEVIPCASYKIAASWLEKNCKPADIILVENDLPDLYESRPKF